MKTIEIITLPTPILLVWGLPLPDDAKNFRVIGRNLRYDCLGDPNLCPCPDLSGYKFIAKLSDLTEVAASKLVGKNYWDMGTGGYIDYASDDPTDSFVFPLQSFRSSIPRLDEPQTIPENTLIFIKL